MSCIHGALNDLLRFLTGKAYCKPMYWPTKSDFGVCEETGGEFGAGTEAEDMLQGEDWPSINTAW
jgi:hypothetical protein